MSRRENANVKLTSSAELRALRATKGTPVAGPMLEASRRAQAIRDGLDRLTTLTDTIIEAFRQEDWKTLGYASFTAYTQAEFGERLNLTPAQRSVLAITFVEAGLSKRATAAAIGVDESTIRQDLKVAGNPAPSRKATQVNAPVIDGETVPETAATEVGVSPVAAPTGDGPDSERPVPGDPQDSPAAVIDQVALVAQQPGVDSPDRTEALSPAPEPARVHRSGPERPSTVEGSADGDEEGPGSSLPGPGPSDLPGLIEGWVRVLDSYDAEALAPLLTDDQMKRLFAAADDIAHWVEVLSRWRI